MKFAAQTGLWDNAAWGPAGNVMAAGNASGSSGYGHPDMMYGIPGPHPGDIMVKRECFDPYWEWSPEPQAKTRTKNPKTSKVEMEEREKLLPN